jgi:hypothetical protein
MTYSAYKINQDNTLSHRENLDNFDAINEWLNRTHHNHVLIIQDDTNIARKGYLLDPEHLAYVFEKGLALRPNLSEATYLFEAVQ